eukprot:301327_1
MALSLIPICLIYVLLLSTLDDIFGINLHGMHNIITLDPEPITITNVSHDMSKIIEYRLQIPPKCSISRASNPITSKHNWAQYYFRCKYMVHHPAPKSPWIAEAFVTKDIFYNHVFKAAGTTIQGGLVQLARHGKLKNLNTFDSEWVIHGGQFENNPNFSSQNIFNFLNDNALIFTFIRDPLAKFLSAFYEVYYRIVMEQQTGQTHPNGLPQSNETFNSSLSGIQILRIWIDHMLQHPGDFIDSHAFPNTKFLQASDWSMSMPFNFIGHLDHLTTVLPELLAPYIDDVEFKVNTTLWMQKYFRRRYMKKLKRQKHKSLGKYEVRKSELSDKDVRDICELYWLDYLCFPFELPEACDLEQLVLKHYGKDIEYLQCYP